MNLESLLAMLVAGGAAGSVSYLLLKWWPKYAANPDPDVKRWIAIAATELVALAAWGGAIWMGFVPMPGPDAQAWVNAIANILIAGGTSYQTSQMWHTKELRVR